MVATVNKTKTQESVKDLWGTSDSMANDARILYGRDFRIDVATMPHNARASRYILPPDYIDAFQDVKHHVMRERFRQSELDGKVCVALDALNPNVQWENDWFCNPPFNEELKKRFIRKAFAMQKRGFGGMMVLPYVPIAGWWAEMLDEGVIIYEPTGRYNYVDTNGIEQRGCAFDSCIVGFPTFKVGPSVRVRYKRFLSSV